MLFDPPTSYTRAMELPVISLRDHVFMPGLTSPLSLGRPQSLAAAKAALAAGHQVAVFTQRSFEGEDLFEVGVLAAIDSVPASNAQEFLVELKGLERIRRTGLELRDGTWRAEWEPFPIPSDHSPEVVASLQLAFERAARLGRVPSHLDFDRLCELGADQAGYLLVANLRLPISKSQELLEMATPKELLEGLNQHLSFLEQVQTTHRRLIDEATQEVRKGQQDDVLRQELAIIHKELGDDPQSELEALKGKVESTPLSEEARLEAGRQLLVLERMGPMSAEYNVSRSYLELLLELPWSQSTEDKLDLPLARRVLEEDHFGLEQVKERILEHLAVMKLNPESHAPILCFVGPPGTGKTSLGKSIARALGRKFDRLSLGGMHDESELRGHRRTYVGAMTGQLIKALRRCKVKNPLIMLDEVDKLRYSHEGDPAAALLEILDPAQNNTFHDNYLDLPFDLSRVFFITTANTLDTISPPLLDRMEVIALSGYTPEEKLEIARRHLIPRLLRETGLPAVDIPTETILALLKDYTREAGVRQLERALARLLRRLALGLAEGKALPSSVPAEQAREMLGPEDFLTGQRRPYLQAGTAVGLAYTEWGGELLYVEVARLPRAEQVVLTGNLGEVMRESARAARSYLLSRYPLQEAAVHIHVPAGATPKDGPSAGLAMLCALASAFSGLPARADTAMTGEITLCGLVLPIGGLKEKLLCAQRAGLKRVILPEANASALSSLPASLRHDLELILVKTVDQVLPEVIPGFAEAFPRPESRPGRKRRTVG